MKRALLPLMTLLLTFGFGPVGAAPNPYQIYARARSVWLSAHYPTYLSYTIAVTVEENGVSKANHYRAIYDALHDRAYVEAVSEEERADPHVPT
ncbi:MAG TPA: hypothetical protein VNG31_05365, partial [Candidatus Baltobacteraceae bacterium]|nr:hypothetical protein [Candidatus Baltobacteraceae bacterium]